MKGKLSFGITYYVGVIIAMFVGIWIFYLGEVVHLRSELAHAGLLVMLLSVIAFFIGNVYYMIESSEPENMIKVQLKN